MARPILVLMLAALPALAQYNANLYNVRPSGGAVGQVCFYETAANGSNKVCLSAAASLAGDATFKLPTADGSAGQALTTDGSGQLSWSSVGVPPFSDANPILKDDSDATKELLFSIGGFTTATQRTVTVPNASFIMAGQNIDNAFSALQSFTASIDAAPSGGSGDYIKTRVVRIYQDTSTTVHWFFETPSSNTFRLKANDAKPALTFDSGTSPGFMILADNTATSGIAFHFIPGSTSGIQDLGASSTPWRTAYLKTSLVHGGVMRIDSGGNGNFTSLLISGGTKITASGKWGNLDFEPATGSSYNLGGPGATWSGAYIDQIDVTTLIFPTTNNTVPLGASSLRFSKLWVTDIDVSGTCTGCSSSGLPVVDTTSIVEGSSDATKELRFEVDGFTTGTTRVMTPPNANATLAGINIAQTWTATQSFGGGSYYFDISGNVNAASYLIGGVTIFNSSRYWNTGSGSFEPSSSAAASLGSPSRLWSELYMFGAITQNGTSRLSGAGVFNGASFNVAGTEVISSGRVFKPVSLDVNGTANVIDSSRNANVVSITVNGSYGITSAGAGSFGAVTLTTIAQGFTTRLDSSGNFRANNMRVDSQLHLAYTDDNSWTIGSTTTTAKLAIYDTSGSFIGWVPVFP